METKTKMGAVTAPATASTASVRPGASEHAMSAMRASASATPAARSSERMAGRSSCPPILHVAMVAQAPSSATQPTPRGSCQRSTSRRVAAMLRKSASASALLLLSTPCVLAQAPVLGVPKSDWPLYTGDTFTCKDQSATVPSSKLNDEYCDCMDGSDEPGTSACAGADSLFYCANRGFRPLHVRSSVVNDGICDCCDGTDEHSSGAGCVNHCIEAGKDARAGAEQRVRDIESALATVSSWGAESEAQRTKWQSEIEELRKGLEEKKAARAVVEEEKRVAEEKENELREAHLKKKAEEEAAKKAEEERLKAEEEAKRKEAEEAEEMERLARGPPACISWRQTGACSKSGPREEAADSSCTKTIESDASGFCECAFGDLSAVDCVHESFTCQDVCNGEAPAEPLSGAAYTASLNPPAADAPAADAADATGAGASAAPADAEAEAFEGGGGEPPAAGAATADSAETAAGGDAYDADGNYVGGGAAGDGYVPPEEDAEDNPYLAHGEDGDGTDEPPDDYPIDPDDIPPPDDYTPPDEDDYGREYDDDYSRYHDDDDYGAGAEYDYSKDSADDGFTDEGASARAQAVLGVSVQRAADQEGWRANACMRGKGGRALGCEGNVRRKVRCGAPDRTKGPSTGPRSKWTRSLCVEPRRRPLPTSAARYPSRPPPLPPSCVCVPGRRERR